MTSGLTQARRRDPVSNTHTQIKNQPNPAIQQTEEEAIGKRPMTQDKKPGHNRKSMVICGGRTHVTWSPRKRLCRCRALKLKSKGRSGVERQEPPQSATDKQGAWCADMSAQVSPQASCPQEMRTQVQVIFQKYHLRAEEVAYLGKVLAQQA